MHIVSDQIVKTALMVTYPNDRVNNGDDNIRNSRDDGRNAGTNGGNDGALPNVS
jgi:hypothetical protein